MMETGKLLIEIFYQLRHVKAWAPTECKDPLMTQKDPSTGFHKDIIRHISLK